MAQQRARVLAMRARKLAAKKAAEAAKKYGSGKTKGVTRDTSKDQSRKKLKTKAEIKRYGSGGGNATTRTRTGGKSRSATTTPVTSPQSAGNKPVQTQSKVQKATQSVKQSNRGKQRFFEGAEGGIHDKAIKNLEKAKRNFFRSSSGTRGENLPPNPKLLSQPTKPKRSSFPAGRAGAAAYAAARAKYRKLKARVPKVRRKTNRRGRAI